jgi:osmotically-inducible protein OsmY
MVVANEWAIGRPTTKQSLALDFVRGALERCPYAAALRKVRVEDRGGVLALSGVVRSYYLKQLAQQLARTHGDGEVVNEIEVEAFRRTPKRR